LPKEPDCLGKAAAALYRAAAHLDSHPRMGRKGRLGGTCELVAARLPFIILYRVERDRVEVLRVIHGRRDWRTAVRERP
jgi:toxin ParE1/3/4